MVNFGSIFRITDNINSTNTCNILIIGDLNADFNSRQGHYLNSFAVENNLNVLIKEPTRITDTSSTVLDQCLTNFPNYIKTSGTEPPIANNDHCTIYVKLLFRTKKSKCYRKTMWNFNNVNLEKYVESFTNFDWSTAFQADSVDKMCNTLTGKILQSAKDWIPHKEVTVRNSDKPFYNGYLRRLRRKVHRLHTKAKRCNTFMSWDVYKLERNFYFREVARCKNEYLTCLYEKIDNEDLHQRSFFKLAKSFLSKTADISTPPLLSPEGILISDDQAKANAFNSFFSEASRLDDSSAYLPNDDSPKCNILDQILVSEEDVKDQIRLLDGNKSYGPDGISPKFIKLASFSLVKPLTKLLSVPQGMLVCVWESFRLRRLRILFSL